jgi:hypothetical protein
VEKSMKAGTLHKAGSAKFATMKYNQTTLDKLEAVLEDSGYVVRYERGNFQSGYCILEDRKVVVLNKFLVLESRISTVMDLIPQVNINFDSLTAESQKLYEEVISKAEAKEANE